MITRAGTPLRKFDPPFKNWASRPPQMGISEVSRGCAPQAPPVRRGRPAWADALRIPCAWRAGKMQPVDGWLSLWITFRRGGAGVRRGAQAMTFAAKAHQARGRYPRAIPFRWGSGTYGLVRALVFVLAVVTATGFLSAAIISLFIIWLPVALLSLAFGARKHSKRWMPLKARPRSQFCVPQDLFRPGSASPSRTVAQKRTGPGCLNRFSLSISGASARLDCQAEDATGEVIIPRQSRGL
jgi:hypothetical protein